MYHIDMDTIYLLDFIRTTVMTFLFVQNVTAPSIISKLFNDIVGNVKELKYIIVKSVTIVLIAVIITGFI